LAETDVLNPNASDPTNPSMGYVFGRPQGIVLEQAASGKVYGRFRAGRGHVYELTWSAVEKTTMEKLKQWAEQYELGFFTFVDHERSRRYSGRFVPDRSGRGPLDITPLANNLWNIAGTFEEMPGKAMQTYPSDWLNHAKFIEERDDDLADTAAFVGTWTLEAAHANFHPSGGAGRAYSNANTGTTDTAKIKYFGYGFRLWSRKNSNLGIFEVSVKRVRDGVTVVAATNIDLYAAADTASAVLHTSQSLALDWYEVQLKATNTKNASSSGNTIYFDAIEVMR